MILRGKKNSILVGDRTITSAKAIAEEIKRLFGLSPETLSAITYRAQRSDGLFLSLTDSEKKTFLTQILNLDSLEVAVEAAEARVKQLQPDLDNKIKELDVLSSNLEMLKSQVLPELLSSSEIQAKLEETQGSLVSVANKIKHLQIEAKEIAIKEVDSPEIKTLEEALQAARFYISEAVAADKVKEQAFRAKQEVIRQTLKTISYKEATKVSVIQDIAKNKKALEKTLTGACPTCERTWDEAKAKAEELQKVILNLQAHLESLGWTEDKVKLEAEAKEYFSADPTISKLKDTADEIENSIRTKRVEATSASSSKYRDLLSELNTKKAVLENEQKNLQAQIHGINQQNTSTDTILSQHQRNLKKTQENQEVASNSIKSLKTEVCAEKDFVALMGREGFLGVIFEEVLQEIEAEANTRLSKLANVSGVTIQFKTESVSQKGVVKRSITPTVSIGGNEAKLGAALSGGMKTSVELVVDLALTSVIQRRTGRLPGFMILDEVLTGLGAVSAEGALEVLKQESEDKLVIMIEHGSEFKEFFSETVEIRYTDGQSEVIQSQ